MKERLIFIDGPNFYKGFENFAKSKNHKGNLDYELLWNYFHQKWKIANVFLFNVIEPGDRRRTSYYRKLEVIGFKVRTKELRSLPDGSWKGDVDAMMIVEVMDIARKYKPEDVEIVIASGDSDFCELVTNLHVKGYSVCVLAFSSTLSVDLINVADQHETMDEIVNEILRQEKAIMNEELKELGINTVGINRGEKIGIPNN